ncbi:MAG: cytidylate kinase-like family protein [Treponema sp.]|nr:cytidylate kinase-like family protein [Treponema sp.]
MKKIITISREHGSGGSAIGKMVAEQLGWKYYDKQLIDLAADESGLSPKFIEKSEQSLSSGWFYNMMLGSNYSSNYAAAATPNTLPLVDQIFNAQRTIILKVAKESPCVIVGRCADYILHSSEDFNDNDMLNLFIYANPDDRIKRAIEAYGIPEKDAKKTITQVNKRRANHYNTFTEWTWGAYEHYDILLNSSYAGLEGTAKLIVEAVKA